MQPVDFGLAFLLLIALSFYLFKSYDMKQRVFVAVSSCGLFAITVAASFAIAWIL